MRVHWRWRAYLGLNGVPEPKALLLSVVQGHVPVPADGLHRDCLRTAHAIQTLISTRSPYVQRPVSIWLTSDYGLVSSRGRNHAADHHGPHHLDRLSGPDGRSDSGAKAHALCYQAATLLR
jgi:hypothetical protein